MAHRIIERLRWAQRGENPHTKVSRPRGAKALGLRYERSVGKALGAGWVAGPWFEYADNHGRGFCQPDFLFHTVQGALILECKLTDTPVAESQLKDLYYPVVSEALGCAVRGIIVVKHLTPATERRRVVGSLAEALRSPGIPILHWLGRGPI